MSAAWFHQPTLCAAGPPSHDALVELSAAEAQHAAGSRRLGPGDAITLFDGAGTLAHAHIVAIQAPRAAKPTGLPARIEAVQRVSPGPPLTLIVAACKGDRLDWLIEKCTELGAARFVLTDFERSVVRTGPQHVSRLLRTAIEACKQSRRAWLPRIEISADLQSAVAVGLAPLPQNPAEAMPAHGAASESKQTSDSVRNQATPAAGALPRVTAALDRLFVAEVGAAQSLSDALATEVRREMPTNTATVSSHAPATAATPALVAPLAVVIGPEGGLTPAESAWLRVQGAQPVRLGPYVLRVETAAIAVAAAVAAAWHGATSSAGFSRLELR